MFGLVFSIMSRWVAGGGGGAPAKALAQRDAQYILDRSGAYIETRV